MGLTFGTLTDTPVGTISFFAGDHGLQRVAFESLATLKRQQALWEETPSLKGLEVVGALLAEFNEYLFGIRKTFSVDVDWDVMTGFQREVLQLTTAVPYGQWTTYGAIAKQLGKPGAGRAVGTALGHNPMPMVIPCHRVIGLDHALRGYTSGIKIKAVLLGLEGHRIKGDRLIPV